MVVMAIVALLLTIAAPRYFAGLQRAKEAVLLQDLATMREAIDHYRSDKGVYPASLESLVHEKYLRSVPVDPVTESSESWVLLPPEDYAPGIKDVRSGSTDTANNGIPYANW